jgi:formylglycine-generating enzyme required for sulfatase activity
MGRLAGTALRWLAPGSLSLIPFNGSAASQSCNGLDVEIGAGKPRAKPGAGQPIRDCSLCPEMVVPAGGFIMRWLLSVEIAIERERDVEVPITIARPFAVGRFPVTGGEFAAFASATGHQPSGDCYRLNGTGDDLVSA